MSQPIVLLSGGTGLIGAALSKSLKNSGYLIRNLSRTEYNPIPENDETYVWNPSRGEIDTRALEGVNHVIHMAGAGISSQRWTSAYKIKIRNSRVDSTRLLAESIKSIGPPLKSFISFSGVAIYGDGEDQFMDEKTPATDEPKDFLASVCKDWEAEAMLIPSTILRVPPVLSADGGSVTEMVKNNKRGTVAILGTGKQYFPWIHITDLVNLLFHLMETKHDVKILNACSPEPVTNRELMVALKESFQLRGPYLTVPYTALKLVIGGMAYELCKSSRVVSSEMEALGFKFQYEDIQKALQDIADA